MSLTSISLSASNQMIGYTPTTTAVVPSTVPGNPGYVAVTVVNTDGKYMSARARTYDCHSVLNSYLVVLTDWPFRES